jgi:hypothetical protein
LDHTRLIHRLANFVNQSGARQPAVPDSCLRL